MIWDACADVVVAHLVDRYARPDMLGRLIQVGAPLSGVAFRAIFAIPARSSALLLVAAVAACRIGYTLCDIGHNTLLVRVATTSRQASMVSRLRLVFSATRAGLVGLASSYVLAVSLAADRHAAFALCAFGGGVIYLGTLTLARQVTGTLPAAAIPIARATSSALLTRLWHNRTYRRVLALIAVQSSLIPIFGRALPFFGTVLHGDPARAGPALATMTLARLLPHRHRRGVGCRRLRLFTRPSSPSHTWPARPIDERRGSSRSAVVEMPRKEHQSRAAL